MACGTQKHPEQIGLVVHEIQGVAVNRLWVTFAIKPKFWLNIPAYFGRIRALLKSVGVVPWHVYVK
jgi:hypothetical protein